MALNEAHRTFPGIAFPELSRMVAAQNFGAYLRDMVTKKITYSKKTRGSQQGS